MDMRRDVKSRGLSVYRVKVDKIEVGDGDSGKSCQRVSKRGTRKRIKSEWCHKKARTSVRKEGWVEERRDTKEGGRRRVAQLNTVLPVGHTHPPQTIGR